MTRTLAGDLPAVGVDVGLLHLRHGDGEGLEPGRDAQGLALGLEVFRHPELLRGAAAVDVIRVVKNTLHHFLGHRRCSFLIEG